MQSLKLTNPLRTILSSQVSPKVLQLRPESTQNEAPRTLQLGPEFVNRNPRNLEKLRIGYKPDGYHVDKPERCYWHKLQLSVSGHYVTASIHHFENGEVLKASTSEWGIRKQLYSTKDTSAFINLARVLAHRCLQCGLTEVSNFVTPPSQDGKVAKFLKTLEESGLSLQESDQFKAAQPWDLHRPEKPWEVTVD